MPGAVPGQETRQMTDKLFSLDQRKLFQIDTLIDQMHQRLWALRSKCKRNTLGNYVIECDGLFIHFASAGGEHVKPVAGGIEQATILTQAQAERMAGRIRNGKGTPGRVMTLSTAYDVSLVATEAAYAALLATRGGAK
jgi:hypothetical protein